MVGLSERSEMCGVGLERLSKNLLRDAKSVHATDGTISVLIWRSSQSADADQSGRPKDVFVIVEELNLARLDRILGTIRHLGYGDGLCALPEWLHAP